jgi:hypothetical protein
MIAVVMTTYSKIWLFALLTLTMSCSHKASTSATNAPQSELLMNNRDALCKGIFERRTLEQMRKTEPPSVAAGVDLQSGYVFVRAVSSQGKDVNPGRSLAQLTQAFGAPDAFRNGFRYYIEHCASGTQFSVGLFAGWGLSFHAPKNDKADNLLTAESAFAGFESWLDKVSPVETSLEYMEELEDHGDQLIRIGFRRGTPFSEWLQPSEELDFLIRDGQKMPHLHEEPRDGYEWNKRIEVVVSPFAFWTSERAANLRVSLPEKKIQLASYWQKETDALIAHWRAIPSNQTTEEQQLLVGAAADVMLRQAKTLDFGTSEVRQTLSELAKMAMTEP